jgi:hypothetical protein
LTSFNVKKDISYNDFITCNAERTCKFDANAVYLLPYFSNWISFGIFSNGDSPLT